MFIPFYEIMLHIDPILFLKQLPQFFRISRLLLPEKYRAENLIQPFLAALPLLLITGDQIRASLHFCTLISFILFF